MTAIVLAILGTLLHLIRRLIEYIIIEYFK